jgi:hypothetical protein
MAGFGCPPRLKAVWQHVREASSGEIALQYGFRASIGHKLVVWLRLINTSFVFPYLGWAIIMAVTASLVQFYLGGNPHGTPTRATIVLCAVQCGFLLLVFSANDAVDARYMYPMLVLLLVVVMGFCSRIKSRSVVVVIFALCGVQFAAVHCVALGSAGPFTNQFAWLTKPDGDRSRFDDLKRIIRMTSTATGRYNIVGVEEPWLNANTLSFFAAKRRLDTGIRSYFTSLGYAETNVNVAVKRVEDFSPMYYITLDESFQPVPPNFVNIVSLPMLKHIRMDPHFEQMAVPSANGVLIFKRH